MRTRLSVACVAAVLVRVAVAGQGQPNDDRQALKGAWKPVEQLETEDNSGYELLEFQGDTLAFYCRTAGQRNRAPTKFKLDPKANPKAIDFTPVDGANKGKTYLGIYELNGDRLKIWYRGPGNPRPQDFGRNAGGIYFIVLKRAPAT
jgi:uncharacterized protein (TIGR03067 family)